MSYRFRFKNIIDCGKIEVKQKDLTRGCEKILATISQENLDKHSKPRYPGDTQKHLTLCIYLAMHVVYSIACLEDRVSYRS